MILPINAGRWFVAATFLVAAAIYWFAPLNVLTGLPQSKLMSVGACVLFLLTAGTVMRFPPWGYVLATFVSFIGLLLAAKLIVFRGFTPARGLGVLIPALNMALIHQPRKAIRRTREHNLA